MAQGKRTLKFKERFFEKGKSLARFLISNIPWVIFFLFLSSLAGATSIFFTYKDVIDAKVTPPAVSLPRLNDQLLGTLLQAEDKRANRATTTTEKFSHIRNPFGGTPQKSGTVTIP